MKKPLFVVLFFIVNLLNGVLGKVPEFTSYLERPTEVGIHLDEMPKVLPNVARPNIQLPLKKKMTISQEIFTFVKEKPYHVIGTSAAVGTVPIFTKSLKNQDDGDNPKEIDPLNSIIKKPNVEPNGTMDTAKEPLEIKIKTIKKPQKKSTNNGTYQQESTSRQDQSYLTVHSEQIPKTVPLIPKTKKLQNYQNNLACPSVVENSLDYDSDHDNPLKNQKKHQKKPYFNQDTGSQNPSHTTTESEIPIQNRSEPLRNNYSIDGQRQAMVELKRNKSLNMADDTINNPTNTGELPTIQEESMVENSILWNKQTFNRQQIIHVDNEELIISHYDPKAILFDQLINFTTIKRLLRKHHGHHGILKQIIEKDEYYDMLKTVWETDDLKKFLYEPAVISLLNDQLMAYDPEQNSILQLDAKYFVDKLGMFECMRIMATPISEYEKYYQKSSRKKNIDGHNKKDQPLIQDNHPSVSTSRLDHKNSISNIVDNFSNTNNFEDNTTFIREIVAINNPNVDQLMENNQHLGVKSDVHQEDNNDENVSQTINYGQGKNQHLIKMEAKMNQTLANQTINNQTIMNQTLLAPAVKYQLENIRNDEGNVSQTINYGQFKHQHTMVFDMENKIDDSENGQTVIVQYMEGAIKEEEILDNFNLTKVAGEPIYLWKTDEKPPIGAPINPILLVNGQGAVDGSNFIINPLASIDQLESQLNLSLTHDQSLAHQKLLNNNEKSMDKPLEVNLNETIANHGLNSSFNGIKVNLIQVQANGSGDPSQLDLKPIQALEKSIDGEELKDQTLVSFDGFKNNYENLPPVSIDGVLIDSGEPQLIAGAILDQLIHQVAMAVNDDIKGHVLFENPVTHQTIEEPNNETPTISDSSIPQEDESVEPSSKIQIAVNGMSFKDKIIQYKGDKLDPLMDKIHKSIIHKFKMIIETHKQENCQDTIIIENQKFQWSEPYYDLIKMLEYNIHKAKDPYAINKFSTIMVNLYLLLENNVQKNLKNFYSYTYEKHGTNSHERLLTYKSKFIEFFHGNWDLLKKDYSYTPNFNGEYMPWLSYLFSTLLIYGHQWNGEKTIIVQLIEKQSISEIFINQVKDLKVIELSWHKLWINGENLSSEKITMAFPDGFSRLLKAFVKNCLNLQNIDRELNQWFQSVTTFIKDHKIVSNNYLLTVSNKDFSITLSLILEYLNHHNNLSKTTVAISKRSVPQLQIAHLKDTLDAQYQFKGTAQPLSLYQKFSTPRFNHKKTLTFSSFKPSVENNNNIMGDLFNTIRNFIGPNNNQRNGSEIRAAQDYKPMLKGLELEDEKKNKKKASFIKKQINKQLEIDSSSSDKSPAKPVEKKAIPILPLPMAKNVFNEISRINTEQNYEDTRIFGLSQYDDDYSQEKSN